MMKKLINLLPHLFVWVLFLMTMTFRGNSIQESLNNPFTYSDVFINISTFYFTYFFVLPRLIKQRKILLILLYILLVPTFYNFLSIVIEELIFIKNLELKDHYMIHLDKGIIFYLSNNAIVSTKALLFSSFIWFLVYAFKNEKEKQQLLQQKNEAEMSLLKSQINPHFIFNTLNNIYSLVNQKSDKSLNAIEKLGDLLRFSTTEIRKDFTSLHDEIQYLKNYIDLESLRISTPENILFEDKTENKDLKIAPMILIPFVENAFKHGNLRDFPLEISIETKANQLLFHQKNKISNLEKDKSSGIGIENVKKRLSIIYPDKHQLEILNDGEFYEVNLMVNL